MRQIRSILATALAVLAFLGLGTVSAWGQPAEQGGDSCVTREDAKEVLHHTVDGTTLKLDLNGDKPLCEQLNVVGAGYEFRNPPKSWPQDLGGVSAPVSIQKPGHIEVTAPPVSCGQWDFYAQWGEDIPKPGKELTAPGKPSEPPFVHDFSKGGPSYGFDDSKKCLKPPVIKSSVCCTDGKGTVKVEVTNPNPGGKLKFWVTLNGDQQTVEVSGKDTETVEFKGVANGTYELTVTDQNKKVTESKVKVDCEQSSTPPPPPSTETVPPIKNVTMPTPLAHTGANVGLPLAIGGGALFLGLLALLFARRRGKARG